MTLNYRWVKINDFNFQLNMLYFKTELLIKNIDMTIFYFIVFFCCLWHVGYIIMYCFFVLFFNNVELQIDVFPLSSGKCKRN